MTYSDGFRARFWARVEKRSGDACWPWTGGTSGRYGRVQYKRRVLGAHRVSVELTHGIALRPDQYACHHCDNPLCVRPDHIFVGTAQDNARDMANKKRCGNGLTHCKRGHPFSEENTRIRRRNDRDMRVCIECERHHNLAKKKRARVRNGTFARDEACANGHARTDQNTRYYGKDQRRTCMECHARGQADYRARRAGGKA